MSEKTKGLLRSEFPPHTYGEWKDAAIKLLKGAPFEKKLLTKTHEGITLQPIYRKEDIEGIEHLNGMPGSGNLVRSNNVSGYVDNAWKVSQELDVSTPEEFNSVAKNAISRGQHEINLVLDHAGRVGLDADFAEAELVGSKGVSLSTMKDIEVAFAGIDLQKNPLFIKGRIGNFAVLPLITSYMSKNGMDSKKLRGAIPLDPIGVLSKTGELPISIDDAYDMMLSHHAFAKKNCPQLESLMVCTNTYHNGGASATQELAYSVATATEYIRNILKRAPETDINELVSSFRFSVGLGGNFFMEIAKLRAFRLLWSKVAKAFGASDEAVAKSTLFAKSAMWNKTVYDPYVNMLRGTTEAFAAVVGGVNALHIAPFDAPIRQSDEFSRRIARNTQIILAEECEMAKVIDPAGGSWYIEWLTDQVARKAWDEFQVIEKGGGMYAALKEGTIQKEIELVADEKIKSLAKRKEVLVGSNMFPNATEELIVPRTPDFAGLKAKRTKEVKAVKSEDALLLDKLDEIKSGHFCSTLATEAIELGATYGQICSKLKAIDHAKAHPVRERRLAEIYEELRNASSAFEKSNGEAPKIFQANLGKSRFYRARADWTAAFFQTGGFVVEGDKDFETVEETVEAAMASKAKIVVLTSSDTKYAEEAENFARALKAKGSNIHLIVAGMPGDKEDAWKAAGVNDFVNVRVNNYEMNRDLLTHIGVL
ncbi:MAG: acyl-CoA mutase large subunit family protein [Bacteriovoracaceae bacterium]|nr:acyl-CoA mutase large subunit family protein [Bacteriovoracaceae bacterium]